MKHFKHIFSAVAIFLATTAVAQTTVMDVISGSPDHTSLRAALFQEGLDVVLSDASAEFTVFAPTNASFDALASALGTDLDGVLALSNLTDVLTYHVLGAAVPAADVTNGAIVDAVSTTNTLKLTKTAAGSVYVNQAMVVGADLTADNGVVHSVDAVLLPFETKLVAKPKPLSLTYLIPAPPSVLAPLTALCPPSLKAFRTPGL